MTAFEEMGVIQEIAQAVEEMDWSLPTDIQAEGIPMILGGGDVLMAAETGSGKTGAFCLPILQIVVETIRDLSANKGVAHSSGASGALNTPTSTKWRMNPYDRGDAIAIDADGLLVQSRDENAWHGTRSTRGVSGAGRYYYEVTVRDEGLCRVGFSTQSARLDLGTDRFGFGFGGTGKKSNNRQFDDYGQAFGKDDVVGCLLDLDAKAIRFSKNGTEFPKAFDVPPDVLRSGLFAAICLKNAEISVNLGEQPFKYAPKDWIALSKAAKENTVNSLASGSAASSAPKQRPPNAPYAVIMEPSRELTEQTAEQLARFGKHLREPHVRTVCCVGGGNTRDQLSAIQSGVDIVVGTPGRLEDFINGGQILLSHVRFFVLDECDGLLTSGYLELIKRMHTQIPKVTSDCKRLQMIVCSATLHSIDVKKLAETLMYFPTWIDLKGEDSVPETVHHVVVRIDPATDTSWKELYGSRRGHVQTDAVHAQGDRLDPRVDTPEMRSEAVKLLKAEYVLRAIREHKMQRALVFCRTKLDCDNLERYFVSLGGGPDAKPNAELSCVCLHADRRPEERKANLDRFKRAEVRFLICTDVAARGLDITGLPYVINVTLPDEKQNYVHRIGRVGRAERMGLAISLVSTVKEKVWYHSNCSTKGRGCFNTKLTSEGGCCIWYNELQLLADIEDHLTLTIETIGPDFKVPVNEIDGKVVYGQKAKRKGTGYVGHVATLADAVRDLAELERRAQLTHLALRRSEQLASRSS